MSKRILVRTRRISSRFEIGLLILTGGTNVTLCVYVK